MRWFDRKLAIISHFLLPASEAWPLWQEDKIKEAQSHWQKCVNWRLWRLSTKFLFFKGIRGLVFWLGVHTFQVNASTQLRCKRLLQVGLSLSEGAHPESKYMRKVWGKIQKMMVIWGQIRKGELLPAHECEAGYAPAPREMSFLYRKLSQFHVINQALWFKKYSV